MIDKYSIDHLLWLRLYVVYFLEFPQDPFVMDALLHRQQKIENRDTAAREHKSIRQHHD